MFILWEIIVYMGIFSILDIATTKLEIQVGNSNVWKIPVTSLKKTDSIIQNFNSQTLTEDHPSRDGWR